MTVQDTACLYCDKVLKSGRSDKKFCNENCRNQYHNDQKIADNKETKNINGILRSNRKILKELLNDNATVTVAHDDLLKKGFEFDYHTHYITSHFQNNKYTFCYNYGYRSLEKNKYKVVKSFK